ncbi:MAG TPA: RNA-binding S4 domain-containing protein [Chitinophagaceae bacterium]|nr:RNA-binding S4 domain-containing protein [Chitinophagaceae bacterium]
MSDKEKLRIDKYLWAVRIFKTRSQAALACEGGKVRLRGTPVKPGKAVNIGDELDIRTESRRWLIQVTGLLANRVKHEEAVRYYIDLTPPEEKKRAEIFSSSFHTGKRLSKIGRPTKRQRRDLDDFLSPDSV